MKGIKPQFPNGVVNSVSFVSTTNTARSFGRLRVAGIGADGVAVAGQFGEALSRLVGHHRPVVDLTADRPLKHGRVDESGFWMRVTGRIAARAVFDEHALDALAGDVRQLVLIYESHFGVLRLRRVGDDAAERQGGEKQ